MGTGWIAVDKTLPYKPEVHAIARALAITRSEAVVACIKLWAWVDDMTCDGSLGRLDLDTIDEVAGHTGFAHAMIQVGWLTQRESCLEIPNWGQWNSKSAKARVLTARRNRLMRERKRHDPE